MVGIPSCAGIRAERAHYLQYVPAQHAAHDSHIRGYLQSIRYHTFPIFAESDMVEITPDVKELLDAWVSLTSEQKRIVLQVAKSYHQDIIKTTHWAGGLNRPYKGLSLVVAL